MTSKPSEIAVDAVSIVSDRGFLSELAQLKAHAALKNLGAEADHINWTYRKRRLQRNGIAGIFSIETAALQAPKSVEDSVELKTTALHLAQLWEGLATVSNDDRQTALIAAAIGYEIAGYRANAATIAERLSQTELDSVIPAIIVDFLRRRLLAVVDRQEQLERVERSYEDLSTFVGEAADRYLGRAFFTASLYLLGGNQKMSVATQLLDRAQNAYSIIGKFSEANLCYMTKASLPLMEQRTTWDLIADASNSGLWKRYLKLIARGTTGRPVDARSHAELWPSQILALQRGLITSRDSMVLRLPTSAGKTRIAEIAIAYQLSSEPNKRCLYVAPFRALVSEIENTFETIFADLGVRSSSFLGGYDGDEFEQLIAQASDLLIVTPERLDLLERTVPEFFDQVGLVILDEGHIVADKTRGVKYEMLVSRLRVRLPEARFILMSAVVPQQAVQDFADWIKSPNSTIVESDWRPSVQRVAKFDWRGEKGVIEYESTEDLEFPGEFLHGVITQRVYEYVSTDTGHTRRPKFPDPKNKSQIAAELAWQFSTIGPVLVFCPQTNYVQAAANAIARRVELSGLIGDEIPNRFTFSNNASSRVAAEWLGEDHQITKLLRIGIGVHHGRLPERVRIEVENDFRKRDLSVLVATNTLAQGVNLPVRTVIIHSCYRHDGNSRKRISAREYWNIAGRAGRAGFETEGTIVHIATERADHAIYRYYQQHRKSTEPVHSALIQLLYELKQSRIVSQDVSDLLNAEIMALMIEESSEDFEQYANRVFSHSFAATQITRMQQTLEPIKSIVKDEAERIRSTIQDNTLLQIYRQTGLSSDSCQTVSQMLIGYDNLLELLGASSSSTLPAWIELLSDVVKEIPEFRSDIDPAVNRTDATWLWLNGETVSEIERILAGSIDPNTEFGRFAARYFVDVLPWATSVILNLAKHDHNLNDDDISPQSRSLPSMIRYGVPSPEAAWCLILGVNGRRAAVEIAADYRSNGGNIDFQEFRAWFGALEIADIRAKYSFRGAALENAIRAVGKSGASHVSRQFWDLESLLPMDTKVVGTQYERRWSTALGLRVGEWLDLKRDIGNAFDRNAILVLKDNSEIGYLPRVDSVLLAPEIDSGLRVRAQVLAASKGDISVRVIERSE